MEKYDNLGVIGEGSYGVVIKCKHKESGQIVAIKKFLETEDDPGVKKIALREVRMLKRLRHEHLINLIEVFRRRRKLYLVFEYVDHTILEELEENPSGLDEDTARKHVFQVLRAINFCHQNNIIHRDVKPENILVSKLGVVKLCDFGFARMMANAGEIYTDYVATRWYRAPELLVGDPAYGKEVDIWAIGCLYAEMLSGDPLFPGDSDIDQLFHIVKCLGTLCQRHRDLIAKNPIYNGINIANNEPTRLNNTFPTWSQHSLKFVNSCLDVDPTKRPTTVELLNAALFTHDDFNSWFLQDLRSKLQEEFGANPLLRKKKHLYSANRQKSGNEDFQNKKNREKSTESKNKGRRPSDNEGLFDEVFKKSLVYSQKYTPGKQNSQSISDGEGLGGTGKGSGKNYVASFSTENKRDSSARSDLLSITPGGTMELDSFIDGAEKEQMPPATDLLSPQRLSQKNLLGDFNTKNTGLKRFDGFEQGLNNFHINTKGVLNQRNVENARKSPPNKKTKKANLDYSLDSPAFKESTDKLNDSADKFLFLERAFDRAFQFEEGPKSLTPALTKDQNRHSGRTEKTTISRTKGATDDFWLPKVSGATGSSGRRGGRNGQEQFQHVIEGVSSIDSTRRNLPHV